MEKEDVSQELDQLAGDFILFRKKVVKCIEILQSEYDFRYAATDLLYLFIQDLKAYLLIKYNDTDDENSRVYLAKLISLYDFTLVKDDLLKIINSNIPDMDTKSTSLSILASNNSAEIESFIIKKIIYYIEKKDLESINFYISHLESINAKLPQNVKEDLVNFDNKFLNFAIKDL